MEPTEIIRNWVSSNYEETDNEMDIVKVSDMYLYFTYSTEYSGLSFLAKKALTLDTFMLFLERYDVRKDRKMIKRVRYTKRVHYLQLKP